MKNTTIHILHSILLTCTLILFGIIFAPIASAKFINTFLLKIGGGNFSNNDATAKYLAKYDLIITRKMESDDIGGSYGSTWMAIKSHNPNTKIHLYTQVNTTHLSSDSAAIYYTNNLARYGVSRGHSDGKLKDHNNYFLHRNGAKLEYIYNGSFKGFFNYYMINNDNKFKIPFASSPAYPYVLKHDLSLALKCLGN